MRRYVALLSSRGAAPSTSARKLAALRALFASQREHGLIAQNPADLVSTPRRGSRLPRVLSANEASRLLDSIPGSSPLELRDRAMFELAYSSGLRAEELVSLRLADVDHDGEQLRVEGKGRKTRVVPAGEPAMAALRDYLERARPALAPAPGGGAAGEEALFLSRTGQKALDQRRAAAHAALDAARRNRRGGDAALRCATASPRTCSTAARTCGRSRRCSGTPASPALRFTLG